MDSLRSFFTIAIVIFSLPVSGQYLSAHTNEIRLNLSDALPNTGFVPVIEWISPRLEHTVSQQNEIHLEAKVTAASPIREMFLVVSDPVSKTVYGRKNIKLSVDVKAYHLLEKVHAPSGSVAIELTVTVTEGVSVSGLRSIMVGEDLATNAVLIDRKDYALIFATDKYDHWDDLVNPVNDAHSIAAELQKRYGFETEIVENPTMEEVWEKIRAYSERKFKPQDQLLVFFAGHGQYDDTFGEGYVVARNSLASDKSKATYISHNRLRGVINNIPCQHIFLLMDVCFGGTFDPVLARSRAAMSAEASGEELIVRKLSHKTRKYLTSGGKEYVSDGVPGSHSPFAGKLIESLKTNGGDDRMLTLAELQSSLEKLRQLPRFGSFGDDEPLSDFIFIGK